MGIAAYHLDELSEAAVAIYPDLVPLLEHVRARTYWGFAFRYPMPAESEGVRGPPTAEEIEENLQQLHHLRTYLATSGG